jgi:low molecular weight protein-tyrosine phosphatase
MSDSPFRILVVCTANICRSVMAERMLRQQATARGLDLEVTSCGLLFDDEPASDTVIAVLDERDLDARDHRSRKFDPSMLDDLDLVLTMERRHARELAVALDGASARVHTFGAFVSWLAATADAQTEMSPAARVAEFAATRRASDLLGNGSDEVDDPHGRSKRVHRKTADRIEDICVGLLDGLFPG